MKDFLEHVAVVRVSRGWEFALPYDEDFVRKHPDVARRQHMLWAGIQAKYGAAGAGGPRGVCPSRPGDAAAQACGGAGGAGLPGPVWAPEVRPGTRPPGPPSRGGDALLRQGLASRAGAVPCSFQARKGL